MEIYVAGSRRDIRRVKRVQAFAKHFGHKITFDWTGHEGELRNDWSEVPDRARALSSREILAIRNADVVIEVDLPNASKGRCIEVGIAIALGKEIWVYEPRKESVFYYQPNVTKMTEFCMVRRLLETGTYETKLGSIDLGHGKISLDAIDYAWNSPSNFDSKYEGPELDIEGGRDVLDMD